MYCHYCGSTVDKSDTVCKKCGYNLELCKEGDKETKQGLMHPALQWIIFAIIVYFGSIFLWGIVGSIGDYQSVILLLVCGITIICILLSIIYTNKLHNIEKRIIELSEIVNKVSK